MSNHHRTWTAVKNQIYNTPTKRDKLEETKADMEESGDLPRPGKARTFDRYEERPAVEAGQNMEKCDRCTDPNPTYPWICPGHPAERVKRPLQTLKVETRVPEKYVLIDLETEQAWCVDEHGHWRPFKDSHEAIIAAHRARRKTRELNERLRLGLVQAAAGQTIDLGDFSRYLPEDNDDDGETD